MKHISRREFVRLSALGIGAAVVSTGLAGCGSSHGKVAVSFSNGVASGDPLQDRVIIWTRAILEDLASVEVSWEVATDREFANLVHTGVTQTDASRDHTVKVDVQNLVAETVYYYRFRANDNTSTVGRMKTLANGPLASAKLAVVSCSNYPAGFFHVYREVAKRDDLDAVLHLGDYLYEYEMGGYATEDAVALGRTLAADNAGELLTLTDYRRRYALYRSDPDLQTLHAKLPLIAVWDDHEVTNDTWRDGAENHTEATEGPFSERRMAALQAYFEWLPIRPAVAGDNETIYRHFRFGDLADLYMLDTRVIARDEQLAMASYLDPATGTFDAARFAADIADQNRNLLGAEQMLWLQQMMTVSQGKWQVLGQQVLMGRMLIPAEMLQNPASVAELVAIQQRIDGGDDSVTEQERSRVETKIPYNLDAWDGYAYEREVILGLAKALDKNLIVLAGDTHNAWANNLKTLAGDQVGVEFATASVSSPGLESYLGLDSLQAVLQSEYSFGLLIEDLAYCNLNQRGYMVLEMTQDEARADWHFVNTIKAPTYIEDSGRHKALKVRSGHEYRYIEAI
ncbi:alkaline phosphatase D family protein [Neptunomonas marina]|uniref:Alkaline phosphatase n=1 Tax=Neptunomonas marina TaxID=1815562 RepID=A0A437Q902_9GAMM|nr:alkaline phosphatase D family protein [Neptunomonas marina]RVU31064.1 alkaline phosphatase [Neptunomonas marina]